MLSPWKARALGALLQQQATLEAGHRLVDGRVAILWSLPALRTAFAAVRAAFSGGHFVHTMAIKANPYLPLLRVADAAGVGFECASKGELLQALAAVGDRGRGGERIVFDSPVKTRAEIELALRRGVKLNADNFQELAVVAQVRGDLSLDGDLASPAVVGLRVNPEIGLGTNAHLSTATSHSKFGVGLVQYRQEILDVYAKYDWLNMMHVHAGSQGLSFEQMAQGIRRTTDLALAINKQRPGQIRFLDIGGGLAVDFTSEHNTDMQAWAGHLQHVVPEIFAPDCPFQVLTEFGRWYFSKAGVIVSRVEYIKKAGDHNIILQHAGADLLVRTVYHPDKWVLRVSVFDSEGRDRSGDGEQLVYDVAGPCCFAGDIIAHQRELPRTHPGDFVMVHDTGGYYHSSWSYYNSRDFPQLWAWDEREAAAPQDQQQEQPLQHEAKESRASGSLSLLKSPATEDTLAFYR
eukprot:m.105898 g.105898  ORF g.105898 m.105898 type:complete len:462 (+) comp18964_c0_seq1:1142-2527(+)